MQFVLQLEECGQIGAGRMLEQDAAVPDGFVVTTDACLTEPDRGPLRRGRRSVRLAGVDGEHARGPGVSDEEVVRIGDAGRQAERALDGPQDMEWALGPGPSGARSPWVLQGRPETVWSRRRRGPASQTDTTPVDRIAALFTPRRSSPTRDTSTSGTCGSP